MAVAVFLLACFAVGTEAYAETPDQLGPLPVDRYMPQPYKQPSWDRRDSSGNQVHRILQEATKAHQNGDLDGAVKLFKAASKLDPKQGEAYTGLAKVFADQGKDDLAEKAMAKATKLYNEQLANWSLF